MPIPAYSPAKVSSTEALQTLSRQAQCSALHLALLVDCVHRVLQAFIMMFSNVLIICTMSIQGKSLAGGTSHVRVLDPLHRRRSQ